MPLLHEAADAKKFDVRMVERNITRGMVQAADADKIVKGLPDDGANAEWVNLDVIGATEDLRRVPANGTEEANEIIASLGDTDNA